MERERRTLPVAASADRLWVVINDAGRDHDWFAFNRLWRLRALADRFIGGPGMAGRPDRELQRGDVVDFWVVEAVTGIDPANDDGGGSLSADSPVREYTLSLRALMRMPGVASLALTARPITDTTSELVQTVQFAPSGLVGQLYWYAELPAHRLVFAAMARGIASRAESGS